MAIRGISETIRSIEFASDRPGEAVRHLTRELLQGELDSGRIGAVYRRQLLQTIEHWAEPTTDARTINVLPTLTCIAVGADPGRAIPVQAAWQMVRLAVKLLDDVEDGDVKDQPAVAINTATGLLSAAQLALEGLATRVAADCIYRMSQALQRSVLRACAGQHLDLVTGQAEKTGADPETWLAVAGAKSGEFLAWVAWAGALAGGASVDILAHYREYGYHLGVLLQVADDFNDVWCPNDGSDLAAGSLTLPVCYALSVADGDDRDRLEALLERSKLGDAAAEARVQQRLIDLGAQAYLLVVARMQYRQAAEALRRAHPASPASQQLSELLDRVMPALSSVERLAITDQDVGLAEPVGTSDSSGVERLGITD